MRVLVTGSRDHVPHVIAIALAGILKDKVAKGERLTVIHGDATGADQGAHMVSDYLGCNEYRFPAEWAALGKAAGPRRNAEMLDTVRPDIVLAFPLGESRGTRDCIREAVRRGIPVEVYE